MLETDAVAPVVEPAVRTRKLALRGRKATVNGPVDVLPTAAPSRRSLRGAKVKPVKVPKAPKVPVVEAPVADAAVADAKPRSGVRTLLTRTVWAVTLTMAAAGTVANVAMPLIYTGDDSELVVVQGGSMEPTYHFGTTLIVDKTVDKTSLRRGDAVTFMTEGQQFPTTHRIASVEADADGAVEYTTRGDANNTDDATPVTPANVVGVVSTNLDDVLNLPAAGDVALGQYSTWARTTLGKELLFGPAILLFLLGEVGVIFAATKLDPRTWRKPQTVITADLSDPIDVPSRAVSSETATPEAEVERPATRGRHSAPNFPTTGRMLAPVTSSVTPPSKELYR